ncbi:unnamed protein product [Prorocentrum cordatum]|uniref:Uncharacterized protein n=1 Tax=Prorocentrum cordatum TaxID=2364126 RepID=A0ABN9T4Q5_9DINO|nr:unnamed protein product [Polarella glacialis]
MLSRGFPGARGLQDGQEASSPHRWREDGPPPLPVLSAMGAVPLGHAVHAVALCNALLDRRAERVASVTPRRVAFIPRFHVWLESKRVRSRGEMVNFPRRCLRLELRTVEDTSRSCAEVADEDIIRVASSTDAQRLGNLVFKRWLQYEATRDARLLVVVQAMGTECIETMVTALATSWQKSARSFEGEASHPGFCCLASHVRPPQGSPAAVRDVLQCVALPPEPA